MAPQETKPTPAPREERKHHLFSPSTLQALEVCPHYRNRESENIAAITGTMQHDVVETGADNLELSDDQAAAAAECLDFFFRHKQIMEEARLRALAEHQEAIDKFPGVFKGKCFSEVLELSEVHLKVDRACWKFKDTDLLTGKTAEIVLDGTTAGYVDRVIISHDLTRAEMFDWKFGAWPIEFADNNLQGMAYALGLMRAYPTLETITFYFKQPKLNSVSRAVWTRADFNRIYLRILTVVERAIKARESANFDSAKPTVPNCLFCAQCGICPKVVAFACPVGSKFHPLEIPNGITPAQVLDEKNTALGLRLAAVMIVWATAFKRQNTDRILRGESPVPDGYKIQDMQKREVIDKEKLKATALLHMTEAEFMAAMNVTLGDLEAVINDNTPRGSKKSAVEAFGKALEDTGAVKKGLPIVFLRAIATKGKKEQETSE